VPASSRLRPRSMILDSILNRALDSLEFQERRDTASIRDRRTPFLGAEGDTKETRSRGAEADIDVPSRVAVGPIAKTPF
jgi:hypothetical protein